MSTPQDDGMTEIDVSGVEPLFVAAATSDLAKVEELLAGNADPNHVREEEGATALHAAVADGNNAIISVLLAARASPHVATSDDGTTPLRCAAETGNAVAIKALLAAMDGVPVSKTITANKGTRWYVNMPNPTSEGGTTALYVAAQNGHLDAVQALLDSDADPNLTCSDDGSTALLMAADGDSEDADGDSEEDYGGSEEDDELELLEDQLDQIAAVTPMPKFDFITQAAYACAGTSMPGRAAAAAPTKMWTNVRSGDGGDGGDGGEDGEDGGGGAYEKPMYAAVVNALLAKVADPNI